MRYGMIITNDEQVRTYEETFIMWAYFKLLAQNSPAETEMFSIRTEYLPNATLNWNSLNKLEN